MGENHDVVGHIDLEPTLGVDEVGDFNRTYAERGWSVCEEGCCLSFDGSQPDAAASLRDVIRVVAKPLGILLDGMVVGCEPGSRTLYAVQVRANRVSARLLWPGSASRSPGSGGGSPAPATRTAQVIDLASRRAQA